jgi:hypothetical protein
LRQLDELTARGRQKYLGMCREGAHSATAVEMGNVDLEPWLPNIPQFSAAPGARVESPAVRDIAFASAEATVEPSITMGIKRRFGDA